MVPKNSTRSAVVYKIHPPGSHADSHFKRALKVAEKFSKARREKVAVLSAGKLKAGIYELGWT